MGRWLAVCAVAMMLLPVGCRKGSGGPDLSTPKAAALTFTTALERGDSATAKEASNAGGMELDLVDAMAQLSSGMERLRTAATAKFGDEAKRLVNSTGPNTVSKNIANGDVEQSADRATIRTKDGKEMIQLKFEEGVWKVDVGALIRGQDITRVVPMFRAGGLAARKVADDINADKYKSIDEALQAMSEQANAKFPELMREQLQSSTAPSAASNPETPSN